jgi:electron transport complex protein RnfA
MVEALGILFGAALIHNLVLERMLGMLPLVAVSRKHQTALTAAVITLITIVCTTPAVFALHAYLLQPLDLGHLLLPVALVAIVTLVETADRLLLRASPQMHERYVVYLPMVRFNSAVLGSGLFAVYQVSSFWQAIVLACGAGLGFALVTVATGAIRERLAMAAAPAAFRGVPLVLLSLSLFAMGMMGLTGRA